MYRNTTNNLLILVTWVQEWGPGQPWGRAAWWRSKTGWSWTFHPSSGRTGQSSPERKQSAWDSLWHELLFPPAGQLSMPAHLFFDVSILEHQGEWGDVLPVHTIAALDLNGMFDAFVDLLGGGLPNVGQGTICEGGQDLRNLKNVVWDCSGQYN